MITALIVDDNKHNRNALINLLAKYCTDINVLGEANSVQTAEDAIKKLNPELLFLDIDLGDGNGFELLSKFKDLNLKVIFVTAHNTFAVEAFKVNAVDYLLKPINISDLENAVEKVKKQIKSVDFDSLYNEVLLQKEKPAAVKNKIAITTNNQLKFIEADNIIRCEADGKYTTIVLEDGETLISSKNLKEFETELPQTHFFRVHHSHLVNMKRINYFDKNDDLILMSNGDKIPLAQRKKNEFLEKLIIL